MPRVLVSVYDCGRFHSPLSQNCPRDAALPANVERSDMMFLILRCHGSHAAFYTIRQADGESVAIQIKSARW